MWRCGRVSRWLCATRRWIKIHKGAGLACAGLLVSVTAARVSMCSANVVGALLAEPSWERRPHVSCDGFLLSATAAPVEHVRVCSYGVSHRCSREHVHARRRGSR